MKRSLLLTAFLTICFSAIFFMPKFRVTPSAMNTEIPEEMGDWRMISYQPSDKERKTLAEDTEFSKAHCVTPRYEEASLITGEAPHDVADLSIVLSGEDLTNSIHRPERCMEAQGHEINDNQATKLALPNGKTVPARRLLSVQRIKTDDKGGEITYRMLTYYFFVGHDHITSEHSERNKMDIVDRLMKGEAQHWAYVLVSMPFGEGDEVRFGGPLVSMAAADKKLLSLMGSLSKENIDWKMVAN
jgi:hypothetical protein